MHNSKSCFKCGEIKPLSAFYKHKGMADGRLNKCKECNKKDSKENRLKNIDYYIEYDKSRAMLTHRVKARGMYQKTDRGKESVAKSKRKWVESNLIKRSAHLILASNIKTGKIHKPSFCSECKKTDTRIHGHHDDYAKPLDVRWLCSKCHNKWHKENGVGANG